MHRLIKGLLAMLGLCLSMSVGCVCVLRLNLGEGGVGVGWIVICLDVTGKDCFCLSDN